MIAIVDYGMGNLRSVEKAFEFLGVPVAIVSSPPPCDRFSGVVLPGVGAFGDAMSNLRRKGWDRWLLREIGEGTPFLGICLGLQLLFSRSAEGGDFPGLNVIPGAATRLPSSVTLPHMGWNQLRRTRPTLLLEGVSDGDFVYFVHSFRVEPTEASVVAATSDYGGEFVAAVERANVWGVQFHPEKSQKVGLAILKNFIRATGHAGN